MRQFIYKHHRLVTVMIHILAVLFIAVGFAVAIVLSPGEEMSITSMISLFSGLILAILVEIVPQLSPLRYGYEIVGRLNKLYYGRESFSVGERVSRQDKCRQISERLESHGMKHRISRDVDGFVGRWTKTQINTMERGSSEYKKFSMNYYLYNVEILDTGVWERIISDLKLRLGEDREATRRENKNLGIVNCVCVLSDSVDSDVRARVMKPLSLVINESLTLAGIRVCAADVPSDRYYMCSERTPGETSRTKMSLELLSRMTLGVSLSRLSSLGDKHTREYTETLESACKKSLVELKEDAKRADDVSQIEEEELVVPDGEVIRSGDGLHYKIDGITVTGWIMLPDEAQESFEDVDSGDLEDILENNSDETGDDIPTVADDYRGEIVLSVVEYGLNEKGKLRYIGKKRASEVFSIFRSYLLEEGFERVYLYNEKKNTIDPT